MKNSQPGNRVFLAPCAGGGGAIHHRGGVFAQRARSHHQSIGAKPRRARLQIPGRRLH